MSAFELELKINDKKLTRATRKISRTFSQPQRLFKEIGKDEVEEAEFRVRSSKKDPENRSWKPWSYATLKERKRRGTQSKGLLYDSGNLLKRFKSWFTGKKLIISNTADYAEYLQEGTSKMPKREILGWSDKSEKNIADKIKKEIRKIWK